MPTDAKTPENLNFKVFKSSVAMTFKNVAFFMRSDDHEVSEQLEPQNLLLDLYHPESNL